MNSGKPVTIIGGGLAGLALGIGLRLKGVPVTIREAGTYPRHRVCGEFICGQGFDYLPAVARCEILSELKPSTAASVRFFSANAASKPLPLPRPAQCVSRDRLDNTMAQVFRAVGGELLEHSRWKEAKFPDGVVRATGRLAQSGGSWRWFGLKAHATGVRLGSDLEVHFTTGGYVGLCPLPGHSVNVCGLFRSREATPDLHRRWEDLLRGAPDSWLHKRLAGAEFVPESFCAVAALPLDNRCRPQDALAVGDAWAMIPPLTGNGMSMAFESAHLACEPLVRFNHGQLDWGAACRLTSILHHRQFDRRLRIAGCLHRLIWWTPAQLLWLRLVSAWPGLWRILFSQTR